MAPKYRKQPINSSLLGKNPRHDAQKGREGMRGVSKWQICAWRKTHRVYIDSLKTGLKLNNQDSSLFSTGRRLGSSRVLHRDNCGGLVFEIFCEGRVERTYYTASMPKMTCHINSITRPELASFISVSSSHWRNLT